MTTTFFGLLTYTLVASFVLAQLEIQIEGKNGWAENLPTWRIQNRFTKLIWGCTPYTGYHLWLLIFVLLSFHLPFFIQYPWNLGLELMILGMFFIGVILEDFFWFVFNPYYGIRKFNREHAVWHNRWIGHIPLFYINMAGISVFFFVSYVILRFFH